MNIQVNHSYQALIDLYNPDGDKATPPKKVCDTGQVVVVKEFVKLPFEMGVKFTHSDETLPLWAFNKRNFKKLSLR